jgi:heterodisulfide reductase subunit A
MKGSVLVIGGGIAGLNSALELTAQGFKVILVEKKPTLGGRMAQLDKMFPSDECGMCTILPKLLEITSNPNIQLMAFCEVQSVEGVPGDFKVKILKKPRYIDPIKCNACTECFPACPVGGVPIEFNYGRGASKAISFYSPFPPRKAIIYPEYCTYLKEGKCGDGEKTPCELACKPEAINLSQKPTEVEVNVGAIIVTTGLDVYLPKELPKYGYGKYKNVLTSIEYERLLSGIGPTAGLVKRADGTIPKKVAWVQCVGPKDLKRGSSYCSAVCCMAATTEALGTLDRENESEVTIIHDDIVGYAKGFQEHYRHARKSGVNYLRGKVESVTETENGDLVLNIKEPSGNMKEMTVEMLVLSTNLIPHKDNSELAQKLGIELDIQGFFKERDTIYEPLVTTQDGIYVAGTAQGPKDISESIAQACGAAAGSAALLKDARGTELVKPAEKVIREVKSTDEPKIGVMLCDCGNNIAGFIDMDDLSDYAKSLPNVTVVDRDLFACGGAKYKEMIANNDINRTVVVACSPKTHEHLFQLHTENAGLNKYLMELVNARNHCSWVHTTDKNAATNKAKTLLKMGVARVRLNEPLETIETKVEQSCLVIGGGIAGMACANKLAQMGYQVHLVDKNKELGGKFRMLNKAYMSDGKPSDYINRLSKSIMDSDKITLHLDTEITGIDGFIGQFDINIKETGSEKQFRTGAIVIATGAQELKPEGMFKYGVNPQVLTQLELEQKIKNGAFELKDDGNVVMLSCVSAKQDDPEGMKSYCCNIGCGNILKNAKSISQLKPNSKIHIIHQDWVLPNKTYEQGRIEMEKNNNIDFTRYSSESPPVVADDMSISVTDADLDQTKSFQSDLLVLTTPPAASDGNLKLKEQLGVCLEPNNFFMGALGKLRPLDFTADGIFLCGTAHSPKGIAESIADGEGAASRVATIISKNRLQKEPILSFVVDDNCDGCAYCIDPCVFNAITLLEYKYEDAIKKTVEVNEAVCKGCGVCMATCPKDGIYIRHFKPEQFKAMIKAALGVE